MAKQRSITFQHRLEYVGFRCVSGVLNAMPLDMASALMGKVWQGLAPLNQRHQKVIRNLTEAFPDKDERWIKHTTTRHWNNLGRTFAEGLCVQKLDRQPERAVLTSSALVKELSNSEKGAVFVSLHMGNWEVLAIPAKLNGLAMAGIYQRASNPLVDAFIKKARAPLYPGGLHAKSRDTVNLTMDWIRQGNIVCMMGDLRKYQGVDVPFFGKPAPSNPYPALLAQKLSVPLIAARSKRTSGAHFDIEILEIEQSGHSELDIRIAETTANLHAQFEEWIKAAPEQWMWGHRRR